MSGDDNRVTPQPETERRVPVRPGNLKWGIVVIAAVVGLVATGAAQAQSTAETQTKSFEIIAVDGNLLVVKGPEGTREITVPPDFVFTVNGKKMSVSELKPGMKGTATVTTTTTVDPVYVTEVKSGEVYRALGTSVIVRSKDGFKMFSQGELDKRGVRIYKDGKPVQLSDLRERDRLTAVIVTEGPPRVMTQKEVDATLAAAPASVAPAPAAPAPAAPAPAAPEAAAPVSTAPASADSAAPESATDSMSGAPAASADATPATTTAPAGEVPSKGGRSWLVWAALILLFFVFGRSRT
jgi:hypothetical protein